MGVFWLVPGMARCIWLYPVHCWVLLRGWLVLCLPPAGIRRSAVQIVICRWWECVAKIAAIWSMLRRCWCALWDRRCALARRWHLSLQIQIRRSDPVCIRYGCSLQAARIFEILDWMSFFCQQHAIMPDWCCTHDAGRVYHGAVIVIPRPYPHDKICRVSHR